MPRRFTLLTTSSSTVLLRSVLLVPGVVNLKFNLIQQGVPGVVSSESHYQEAEAKSSRPGSQPEPKSTEVLLLSLQ